MATRGVYTDLYRSKLATLGADLVGAANAQAPLMRAAYFRIGEGGAVAGVPKVPDPTLTNIEAVSNPLLYFFQKSFGPGEVTATSGVLRCVLSLGGAEGNGPTPLGGSPVFYEVGIFDDAGDMIAYVTFDGKPKVAGVALAAIIDIKYART